VTRTQQTAECNTIHIIRFLVTGTHCLPLELDQVNEWVPLRNKSKLKAAENVNVSAQPALNISTYLKHDLLMLSISVPDADDVIKPTVLLKAFLVLQIQWLVFRYVMKKNRALLGYYADSSSNLLPTFWDNPSGPIFNCHGIRSSRKGREFPDPWRWDRWVLPKRR